MQFFEKFRIWLQDVGRMPWLEAVVTLRERFREDRLGLTASSLTFTTTIALVPFMTVALAVFTAFPMSARLAWHAGPQGFIAILALVALNLLSLLLIVTLPVTLPVVAVALTEIYDEFVH
jgi:antibiotic biosynthesis monooxygenase (ABM) superfamily enzyme